MKKGDLIRWSGILEDPDSHLDPDEVGTVVEVSQGEPWPHDSFFSLKDESGYITDFEIKLNCYKIETCTVLWADGSVQEYVSVARLERIYVE